MRIPNINCKIEMFCSVNPSEDPEKTRKSISNIFPYSTTKNENYSISAESNDSNFIRKNIRSSTLKTISENL